MLSMDIYGKLSTQFSTIVANSTKEFFGLSGSRTVLVRYLIAPEFVF